MPRPKEYRREEVLAKATRVFWSQGYAATSVDQLVSVTGLNTASMYHEFGGKEPLYLQALESAYQKIYHPMLAPMRENPGLESLGKYLQAMANYAASPDYCGCIFLNNVPGQNTLSRPILRRVETLTGEIQTLIHGCLQAAHQTGQLSPQLTLAEATDLVSCWVMGLTFYGQFGQNKARILTFPATLLKTLQP